MNDQMNNECMGGWMNCWMDGWMDVKKEGRKVGIQERKKESRSKKLYLCLQIIFEIPSMFTDNSMTVPQKILQVFFFIIFESPQQNYLFLSVLE